MSLPRVVCDTMVLFQWAVSRTRQHGAERAVDEGRVLLSLGPELFGEIEGLLTRPAIRAKAPHLTDAMIGAFLGELRKRSEWIDHSPPVFAHSAHAKDDHIFNLAIAAKADYLVTWENRHLEMEKSHPADARALRELAPNLRIVNPPTLLAALASLESGEASKTGIQPQPGRWTDPSRHSANGKGIDP